MRRAVLAPGLRVVQRSRDELQIGLGRDVAAARPDTEPVRRTLDLLLRGEALPDDLRPARRSTCWLPCSSTVPALVVAGIAAR